VRERADRAGATAARLLPWIAAAALVSSWWLSLIVLLDTPIIDLTAPKVAALVGGVILLATRPWRWMVMRDWLAVAPIAAYLAWFPLAALLRGTSDDLKTAAAYLVFAGLAAAVAYAATRLWRERAARLLILTVLAAAAVSFVAAWLERATHPMPGEPDPLAWLWSIFRPQSGLLDPRLGFIPAPPLHATTGEPGVIRATAFFVQTNYLAFFAVLAVPLLVALLVAALRQGRRLPALVSGIGLAAALVTAYWTYARVGIVAVLGVAAAALIIDWLAAGEKRKMRPSRRHLRPTLAAAALVLLVMGGAFVVDGVGLSRLTGTTLGDAPVVGEPGAEAPPESAAESAARSAGIRLELQRTALEMVIEDERSLTLGSGLAAYETAVHDPASARHLPEATGIRDPNSLWLTVALAGGVIGVLLLAALISYMVVRLVRALRRPGEGAERVALLWLAAWLPVWSVVQLFGTNPFNTSEAIILGTMIGATVGLTTRSRNVQQA
jgi:O-antigen ligase